MRILSGRGLVGRKKRDAPALVVRQRWNLGKKDRDSKEGVIYAKAFYGEGNIFLRLSIKEELCLERVVKEGS